MSPEPACLYITEDDGYLTLACFARYEEDGVPIHVFSAGDYWPEIQAKVEEHLRTHVEP